MNNRKKIKKNTMSISEIVTFMLAINPIISIYQTPISAISWGEVGLLFICVLSLGVVKEPVKINKIVVFELYAIIITIMMTLSFRNIPLQYIMIIKETIGFIVYISIGIFLVQRVDIQKLMEWYVKLALVAACFLVIQFGVHLHSGFWIPGLVPGIITESGVNSSLIISRYSRACSFFEEPAHFAQYLAFPLTYQIFKDEKTIFDKITIILFFASLMLSYTGNGILIICIIFISYLFYNLSSKKKIKKIKGIILTIIGLVATSIILFRTQVGKEIILRITSGEILGENNTVYGNSGYIRILRGYVVFNHFGLFQKIFGVGFGNYAMYAVENAYEALTSKTLFTFSYVNGLQYYLVSTGIVGFIIYLKILMKDFKKKDAFRKTVCILFLAMSSVAALINGPIWLMALIILYSKKYDLKIIEKIGEGKYVATS